MRLKRYINFLNESNGEGKTFPVKFMNNEDRKILQEFLNLLKTEDWDDLPSFLKMTNGGVKDAIALAIFDAERGPYAKVLKKYYIDNEFVNMLYLIEIVQMQNSQWEDGKMDSEELVEEIWEDLRSYLLDEGLIDFGTNYVTFLSDEEEAALPSKKTIHKYDL